MVPPAIRLRRGAALAVAVVSLTAGAVAVAAPQVLPDLGRPATVDERAERIERLGDVVVVYDIAEVDPDLRQSTVAAARDAGAVAMGSRGASVGMLRVRRGDRIVQQAPSGYRYPMIVTALHPAAVAGVMGQAVSGRLGPGRVVMGATTATLRGAAAGDRIDVVAADGSVRTLTVTAVAPDDVIGGTELLVTDEVGASLGIVDDTRVVIWGFDSRSAIDQALARRGVTTRRETRIVRSWDPPSPDSTLSTAETKAALGEFAYYVTSTGAVVQEAAWQAANLPAGRELLNTAIPIRARCHHEVADDLRAALAEVASAGLGGAIDVANANAYGGCHYPRFNRIGGELGYLSRHSWGMALDTNTVSNCQGCVPKMDCRVVRIFRKHGFAWGGNFLRPDGMHFEWVGERRDQIPYPSTYCPNVVTSSTTSSSRTDGSTEWVGDDSRSELFADQTVAVSADHVHAP